ncbi:MAG TPA: adenosylmethionine--8-amino-7-oxononanoate transaminase [Nitrososphaeraceae archaeon]|nr:adenosylmethionine--8-amino-7-oxononanoate transaminase [Nitrososphaeraceae archaeon]
MTKRESYKKNPKIYDRGITKSLAFLDKRYVWHPYTQMQNWNKQDNAVITHGDGFYLVSENGKKYLDGIANMWCSVWGYGSNPVIEAIRRQFHELPHSTLFGLANKPSIVLATKLLKLAKGMDKIFYSDNGSTAMEVALKIAVQYWKNKQFPKKNRLLSLENGYHGDTIATMSMGYVDRYFNPYKSLLIKTFRAPAPSSFENDLDNALTDSEIVDICIEKTEHILQKNSKHIAGLVMESGAQIAGGVSIYPRNYQKRISDLCKKYDVLLILDEIATGFGRLGNMIEYISQSSLPDIVCYGKALNGGYFPIAVTLTTDQIYKEFLGKYNENKQLFHGHTYTGHPAGCAACITNLEMYEKRNLIQKIRDNSKHIKKKLKELEDYQSVYKIRHKGLLVGIELTTENKMSQGKRKKQPLSFIDGVDLSNYVMRESLKRGVLLRSLGNIVTLIPPLAMPRNQLDILIDTLYDIIKPIDGK